MHHGRPVRCYGWRCVLWSGVFRRSLGRASGERRLRDWGTSREHLVEGARLMRKALCGLLQQGTVGSQVEPCIFDGDVAQIGAQRWKQGVDIPTFLVPSRHTTDGEGMAKIVRPRLGMGYPSLKTHGGDGRPRCSDRRDVGGARKRKRDQSAPYPPAAEDGPRSKPMPRQPIAAAEGLGSCRIFPS